jgi:hypothetical protein
MLIPLRKVVNPDVSGGQGDSLIKVSKRAIPLTPFARGNKAFKLYKLLFLVEINF